MNHSSNLHSSIVALVTLAGIFFGTEATAKPSIDINKNQEIARFVDDMVNKHNFDVTKLRKLMLQAKSIDRILAAISNPAEGKPWHQYRPIFVTKSRIRQGVTFWKDNQKTLERAESSYGVPAEIIVAILGVETRYGRHAGGFRVLDSLATLAFQYPPRAKFFKSELEQYLLLTREESIEPTTPKGSYAGAMGRPQFISSSYRNYAVDFDGDGKRDLWNNNADAIGSIANYFSRHGWRQGQPVVAAANVEGTEFESILAAGYKPQSSLYRMRQQGIKFNSDLPETRLGALIKLDTAQGPEYWIGLKNFYVITRYNHSPLYAMAVFQLSQEIKKQVEGVK